LRPGAAAAESEDDYRASHMYETALFALGSRDNCREMASPRDFYLFFHTRIRPRLKSKKPERVEGAYTPPSQFYAETGWIGLCGAKLNFILSSAAWGAAQADMARKYNATSATLIFR
ncbi:MAG TPA: hypothetical protein VMU18_10055, partial [Rhodoblastus sp.]|nr:hypothetical protein [Rhodoblastus sp.]